MREARLIEIAELDPASVAVENRLRPVSDAAVESMISSVEELGMLKDEIIVRRVRHQGGRLVLIAGAHRLEAFRRMGRKVPAKIYDCSDDWARLMELDDNLAGAELGALDTAVFLAERKRIYEKLHPETRAGVAGAVARWDAADTMSVAFSKTTAEKFGLSERHVRRLVAAGSRLSADEVTALRAAARPVALKDLAEIGRIGSAQERAEVVRLLAAGEARNATAARKAWARQVHGAPVEVVDKVDAAHKALVEAFRRAPAEAQRRFVASESARILRYLEELDGGLGE